MTYHTVLKQSPDFIGALAYARELADNITHTLNTWSTNTTDVGVPGISGPWTNVTQKVFPYRYLILCILSLFLQEAKNTTGIFETRIG